MKDAKFDSEEMITTSPLLKKTEGELTVDKKKKLDKKNPINESNVYCKDHLEKPFLIKMISIK